jgi:hypothetical protein
MTTIKETVPKGALEKLAVQIDTLAALAQMDGEAAVAYHTTAELVHVPQIRARLLDFAHEHLSHIKDLRNLIELLGGGLAVETPDVETSTFVRLAAGVGPLGTHGALLSLIIIEQFTNAAYETARRLMDGRVGRLLERNYHNERRHIEWLSAEARKIGLS